MNAGWLEIRGTTISGNVGWFSNVGGIYNAPQGTLYIENSTSSDNGGSSHGAGGIENRGWLQIVSSTIAGNHGFAGGPGILAIGETILSSSVVAGT